MGCSSSSPASSSAAAAEPTGPPPKAFKVSGAGIDQANGIYLLNGEYDGYPKWESPNKQIWLLRYTLPSGTVYWYLTDKALLDRDDGDLYRCEADSPTPPHFGWRLAKDGIEPPPTLETVSDDAPTTLVMGVPAPVPVMMPNIPLVYGVPDGTGGAMDVIVYSTVDDAVPMGLPVEASYPTVLAQPVPPQMIVPVPMATPVEEAATATPTPPKAASWAAAGLTCIGDCLEVKDTHGLWSTARVAATLVVPPHGPLILIHFEGWSNAWFMWLSPQFDADRIRTLSTCPGIGRFGPHTKESFHEKLQWCRAKLCAGASDWGVTGGKERTHPFKSGEKMRVTITDPMEWLAQQQSLERVPADAPDGHWLSCHDLSKDAALCRGVYEAAMVPQKI